MILETERAVMTYAIVVSAALMLSVLLVFGIKVTADVWYADITTLVFKAGGLSVLFAVLHQMHLMKKEVEKNKEGGEVE